MGQKINYKILVLLVLTWVWCLFFLHNALALNAHISNESIQAKQLINQSEKDISEMISKNISVKRVNETYQEALQLYSAQLALEEKGTIASYKLVVEDTQKISTTKKTALEAKDELEIFKETFTNAKKESNLSEFQAEYDAIILSFNDERFEDTLILVQKGYTRISEIQSAQTTTNAFYSATTRTLGNFFIQNGLKIIIIGFIVIVILFVFWNKITKLRMNIRLNKLIVQKKAIKGLIKEMQEGYFKTKKLSETEYKIKLAKYEALIRDIGRQTMVLSEELLKVKK